MPRESHVEVPTITVEEISQTIKRLKSNKTGAMDGLVAEMLKTQFEPLLRAMATFFQQLLVVAQDPPAQWRRTMLKILYKKGDARLPGNSRPISRIPVMATVFSMILHGRTAPHIDTNLSEEQYGFRKGRGCSDAVHMLRMISEKSLEWGEELWVATLDVEKSFDKVHGAPLVLV